jgi:hypothetical protein
MKERLLFTALAIIVCTGSHAQYKKASFLNKNGRTYDVGTTFRLLGGGRSTGIGFFLSYGKENDEKRIHHWYDTEVILGSTFNYTTGNNYVPGSTVQVSGKSGIGITLRYNLAWFLADNSKPENKLLPFVNVAIGYHRILPTDDYTYTPYINGSPNKTPEYRDLDFSAGAGAGIIYRLNSKLGLRFSAMYNGMLGDLVNKTDDVFIITPNHPALNVAVRFRMDRDE